MSTLGKYSFGIGDRFGHQGIYQLQSFIEAQKRGVNITPVWNKSYREHQTVNSNPLSVRREAEEAVKALSWESSYLVDADHVTLRTIDSFIACSDFFTIDVADKIGLPLSSAESHSFLRKFERYIGELIIPGIDERFLVRKETLLRMGDKFYKAAMEAASIYQLIANDAGPAHMIEVSMDEVDHPQTPLELYFILMMLSEQKVPVNTIAPKFSGRFNKGVDYEGDLSVFEREFEQDLSVLKKAIEVFSLPVDLKLSVHTGSDKFSLYPIINKLIKARDVGLHLKTAGTTWLEEMIGLGESDGVGLELAKTICFEALERFEELTSPYRTVLNININDLPDWKEIRSWDASTFVSQLRHDSSNPNYNPHLRQLIHTSYKIAAEKGKIFTDQLERNSEVIGKNVFENLFERHMKPLFIA